MAKKKQSKARTEESEAKEFMEIGGSPVPGITLWQVLRGHTDNIGRIAWSPNGHYLASPSRDKTIRIWDVESGKCVAVLEGHLGRVLCLAWSPDGKLMTSGGSDNTVQIWNTKTWKRVAVLEGHNGGINSIAWSPDNQKFASGSNDKEIRIWNANTTKATTVLSEHTNSVTGLSWSSNGEMLASSSFDQTLQVWDSKTGVVISKSAEDGLPFDNVVWMPNQPFLAASSERGQILIWSVQNNKKSLLLEGHSSYVACMSFSTDSSLLASRGRQDIRIWRVDTWDTVAILIEEGKGDLFSGLAFQPNSHYLATLGESCKAIRIWKIDQNTLLRNQSAVESVRYTTAKLVLVGDSGVGKTGLGWRLAHNEFKEHSSTHGQQFWVVPELKKTREDGTECEAVLWDLAGQPDYRLVHSLYLDDVDTALVLFDPTNRQEPLGGVDFWLNQLKDKDKKPRNSILVGARNDRGTSTLTDEELQAYCERNGISGGYIPTSASNGDGLPELMERLKAQIPWDQMTTTVTTVTFKKIKEFVLGLKAKPKRDYVLVQPDELREQLQATDKDWQFSDAEMLTAV